MALSGRGAALVPGILVLLLGAQARAEQFQIQTVDSTGSRGIFSSIAVDSRGGHHVSYYGDNQLLYASQRDSAWSVETVQAGAGFYGSLALDANDAPHICYFDSTNTGVGYATKAPGYWVRELVDSAGSVGQYATLALDSRGRPAIAYYDFTNGDLKYAERVNGAWSIERADTAGDVGFYTSLAFDPVSGEPCVSYLDLSGGLKFARRTPAGWTAGTIEIGANVGAFSSLVMDSAGYGHISYADLGTGTVKYAEQTALGWYVSVVDNADMGGAYTSLRLDRAGNPRISYIGPGRHLKLASRSSGGWSFTFVDPTVSVTHFTSLVLDANDNPTVSYWDEARDNLKVADASIHLVAPIGGEFWAGGSTQSVVWTGVGPVDVYASQDDGATYSKLTASPDPYHVVPVVLPSWNSTTVRIEVVRDSVRSVSSTSGALSVIAGLNTPWWTQLADPNGLAGFSPSLALTANEAPRVAYWETSTASLRYAARSAGAWTTETIQSGLGTHTQSPLAIDASGIPSVAYFDNSRDRLMWSPRLAAGWAPEIAVPLLASGEHCSMALDRYGEPRIAYFDRMPGRLVLAARFGVSWGTEEVDVGDSVGLWNALALDTLGHPYVSYQDAKLGDLKFASKTGAAWQVETVDAFGDVGASTSLALERDGSAHVSYLDLTNHVLKCAVKRGGVWTIETVDASGRVGGTTSIALDAQGTPTIAYHDAVRGRSMIAKRAGGVWSTEIVTPVVGAGTASSLALDRDGLPRVAYLDDIRADLRYASSAIEVADLAPGTRWPVGALRTLRWDGNGSVSVSLSRDGGLTFPSLAPSVAGGSYAFSVPGPATQTAVLRLERAVPRSVSISDTFEIRAGVDLLSFGAVQPLFGTGADVTWRTDPSVPDIAGYRLERALGGGAYASYIPFTDSTSVHDGDATVGTKYRLTAIAGGGVEYALGETVFVPRRPLAAGPLPYRGGMLAISFASAGAPRTEVRLFDLRGRLVRTIASGIYPAGVQSALWNGKDERGARVGSGLYFLKSTSGGHESSLKVSVVR